MKPVHWLVLLGGLAVLGYAGYQGSLKLAVNADLTAPVEQPADPRDAQLAETLDALNPPDGHRQHVCLPHQHYNGYVYTPHRFPRAVGGEITSAIHHGWSAMAIPARGDLAEWMIDPPSEKAW